MSAVVPPSAEVAASAAARLGALAIPVGALGRLGDLGVWVCATQGEVPPRELSDVRLVIFAGDHGVAAHGVSAYPAEITAAMVRTFVMGKATVSALAASHDVKVRVLDLGVDDDLDGVDPEVQRHKVRRGSGAIHLEDALTADQTRQALDGGRNRGGGGDRQGRAAAPLRRHGNRQHDSRGCPDRRRARAACHGGHRSRHRHQRRRPSYTSRASCSRRWTGPANGSLDPFESLVALGSADLAAATGFMVAAARAGVPVLLDGVISVACALTAERLAPGCVGWFAAGHRSTEPAQSLALEKLGLQPILDLDMRLGEGSGAVAAVPVLRSAVAVMRDVALLADLMPDA